MTIKSDEYLWSTRARDWDFQILHHPYRRCDWLQIYEFAFGKTVNDVDFFKREYIDIGSGDVPCVAFRFIDPEFRRDSAGRLIPHEFIVFGESTKGIESSEQGKAAVWPLVEEQYAKLYETEEPPSCPPTPPPLPSDGGMGSSVTGLWPFLLITFLVGALCLFYTSQAKPPTALPAHQPTPVDSAFMEPDVSGFPSEPSQPRENQ